MKFKALVLGIMVAGFAAAGTTAWVRASHHASVGSQVLAGAPRGSNTLLSDGRHLSIGEDPALKGETATIVADDQGKSSRMALALPERHFHTASAMPDGRVLIIGGLDAQGHVVSTSDWFDPQSGQTSAASVALTPRAGHTATVLTDGRLLVAGGWNERDGLIRQAQLFNPFTGEVQTIDGVERVGATATLMPDGRVALQGGRDAKGAAAANWTFDPNANRFEPIGEIDLLAALQPPRAAGPRIVESRPGPGERDIAVDRPLSFRFSEPMAVATVNDQTVTLLGPQGVVDARVHVVEGGRLAFVQPGMDLLPASFYALYVKGVYDTQELKMPVAAISFDTQSLHHDSLAVTTTPAALATLAPPLTSLTATAVDAAVVDRLDRQRKSMPEPVSARNSLSNGDWHPGKDNLNGHWRTGRALPPLPALTGRHFDVPKGVNAVFGQVLQVDDQPIADVEVTIGARTAHTDHDGIFLLTDVPAGRQELYVDGSSSGHDRFEYGQLVLGVDVKKGEVSSLPQQIFLPKINPGDRVTIDSPTKNEVVLTHLDLPGVEIHIPAGSVFRDHKGRIVHELALVPTPLDRAPYPTPSDFPVYFTLQPGGAMVLGVTKEASSGLRVVYPNYAHAPAGTQTNFWVYDPQQGWKTYGHGQVSADGRQVVPDAGVALYAEMGAGYNLGGMCPLYVKLINGKLIRSCYPIPDQNPPPPNNCAQSSSQPSGSATDNWGSGGPATAADPCDLATGTFEGKWTDISIADVIPIELTRVYNHFLARYSYTGETPFGSGMNTSYDYTLVSFDSTYYYVNLVMPNGSQVTFVRTSGSGVFGSWEAMGEDSSFLHATLISGGATPESYVITTKGGTQYCFRSLGPNNLTAIRDRFGNQLSLTWNNNNQLQQITSPSGRFIKLTWGANGQPSNVVSSVTDYTGRTITYAYKTQVIQGSSYPFLQTVTFPDTSTMGYGFDPATGYMTTWVDRNGSTVVTNRYDPSSGRIATQTLADGMQYSFSYVPTSNALNGDVYIQSTTVTMYDPSTGRTLTRYLTFDEGTELLTDTWGQGQSDAETYSFTRNPDETISIKQDPLGRQTHYVYDANTNVKEVDLMYQTSEQVSYNYTYTADYNQLQSVIDPLGHTISYGYTSGCLTSVTESPQAGQFNTWNIACNSAGQIKSVTDPLTHQTTYGYAGYDLASVSDAMSNTTYYDRDGLGRITGITDPLGNTSTFTYDTNDRPQTSTDPAGALTQYHFDYNGNLKSVIDPANGTIQFGYDSRNRRTSRIDADLHPESWTYDGWGNWLTHTDRNGQIITQNTDDLARINTITYLADPSSLTYQYDSASRVTGVVDSNTGASVTLTPDDFDRLSTQSTVYGSVTYHYDNAGRRYTMQFTNGTPNQTLATYSFDNANKFTGVTQGTETVQIGYDTADRPQTLTLPNGVFTSYGFDNANRLTNLTYKNSAGTQLGNLVYGPDPGSRITSMTGSWSYTQVPSATASDYAYDAGDRLNGGNGLSSLVYDNAGQMKTDGKGNTYNWNGRHQLASIYNGPTLVASFSYDALGRRMGKTAGGQITNYLYDNANIIQEQKSGTYNNLLTGLGIDQIFARTDVSNTRVYYLADNLGSTVALTTANGTVAQRYAYDPYGTSTKLLATTVNNPYTYTGREDDGTGLYYYRARYYNPMLGRFVSEDPIGLNGGLNVYAYVHGNPLGFRDPLGLAEIPSPTNIPGGPWTPSGSGQREGSFWGPKPAKGPRAQCQWVPKQGEGGPPGSKGYWKTQTPGQNGWSRFDVQGEPLTPEQAHPGCGCSAAEAEAAAEEAEEAVTVVEDGEGLVELLELFEILNGL